MPDTTRGRHGGLRRGIMAAAFGSVVGVAVGVGGEWRAVGDARGTSVGYPAAIVFGLVIGGLAGTILHSLGGVRSRGRAWHYGTWAVAVGLSVALVALPGWVAERDWRTYVAVLGWGIGIGVGLGLVARWLQGRWW